MQEQRKTALNGCLLAANGGAMVAVQVVLAQQAQEDNGQRVADGAHDGTCTPQEGRAKFQGTRGKPLRYVALESGPEYSTTMDGVAIHPERQAPARAGRGSKARLQAVIAHQYNTCECGLDALAAVCGISGGRAVEVHQRVDLKRRQNEDIPTTMHSADMSADMQRNGTENRWQPATSQHVGRDLAEDLHKERHRGVLEAQQHACGRRGGSTFNVIAQ